MKSLAGLKLENVNIFSDEVAQARIGHWTKPLRGSLIGEISF